MRFREAVEAVARRAGSSLAFHRTYPSAVVSQSGDELELQPDGDDVPGEVGAPIRLGLPGVTVKVPAGSRVQLAYEQGDPQRPAAGLWEAGTEATSIEVEVAESFAVTASGMLPGQGIALGAGGQPPAEHVLTTEAFLNLMFQFFLTVGPTLVPPITLPPSPPYPDPTNPSVVAALGMLAAASSSPLPQSLVAALSAAFLAAPTKPTPPPGMGQAQPGLGCKAVTCG